MRCNFSEMDSEQVDAEIVILTLPTDDLVLKKKWITFWTKINCNRDKNDWASKDKSFVDFCVFN